MFAKQIFIKGLAALSGLVLLVAAVAAQAQSSYLIRSGDTLRVEVLEDPSLNRSALVLPDGSISFPFVGSVRARGMTVNDLSAALAAGLAPNFAASPTVVVAVQSLVQPREAAPVAPDLIDVYVMGEVSSPGRKEVEPGITILQLLAEAGGVTSFAATARVELHRVDPDGQPQIFLYAFEGRPRGPTIGGNTVLGQGDVVVVPQRRLFE